MSLQNMVSIISRTMDLLRSNRGNVAITFALALVPIMGAAGVAVDYSKANSAKAALQASLDSAALSLIRNAASNTGDSLTSSSLAIVKSNFNRPEAKNLTTTATYDKSSGILTVSGSADIPTSVSNIIGIQKVTINGVSKSKLAASKLWPVCVLITNPTDGHTLLVKNQASIDFYDCLVQVNTKNWDAVEARDTSYIHSTNGLNCFTGDIHYGDVVPPKQPTCDMLPDPFATFNVPINTCDYTNFAVTSNATLSPGTYCGGINITGGTVTFSPGIYTIQNGDLKILNSSSANGNGVTFLISGKSSNVNINTSGTITLSPSVDGSAGQFSGFLFYWDQPSSKNGQTNLFSKAQMNLSGILYFSGQVLSITNNAKVVVNTGTIVADELLPDGARLELHGTMNSSSAASAAMRKSVETATPSLIY